MAKTPRPHNQEPVTKRMYVHLGSDLVVRVSDVVVVLDASLLPGSEINRELVEKARGAQRLLGDGVTDTCKSLVITRSAIVTSGISPATLVHRMTARGQAAMTWERETRG